MRKKKWTARKKEEKEGGIGQQEKDKVRYKRGEVRDGEEEKAKEGGRGL